MVKAPGTITPSLFHDRIHVVMVEPADNLNIGSVARAMKNLGFSHLHLVRPPEYNREKAKKTACWGEDLLSTLIVHDSYEEALAPMQEVVGFSTRDGKNRSMHMMIGEWVAREVSNPPPVTALVFGPEDSGLRQEHVALCRCLVRIPTTEACPAFNLAQSVLLALYELSKFSWSEASAHSDRTLPDGNQFMQLDRLIAEVLTKSEYYKRGTPSPVPDLVRSMVRRVNPDEREMRVLLGIFSRISRTIGKLKAAEAKK